MSLKYNLLSIILLVTLSLKAQSQFKTLDYFYQISGNKTAAGQHNREPNAEPDKWTNAIFETTGVYPKLWSGDFLFQKENINSRWKMILEAEKQWSKGAIIHIMWHTCSPLKCEPCGWDNDGVLSPMSNDDWTELLTPGSASNQVFFKRLDELAVYLDYLKEKGVEVMFRPFHEMNQKLFWWGGRPGTDGTRKLYRITHDYLTHEKGLTNLIWIWDVQDLSYNWEEYNPGDAYWDIMSLDVYEQDGFTPKKYELMLKVAGDKPIAIGECAKLPTPEMLEKQPRWVFFMAWAELVYENNTIEEIKHLYKASNVDVLNP